MHQESRSHLLTNSHWMVWIVEQSPPSHAFYPFDFQTVDSRDGQGLRNYKTLIKNGQNATTPFSGVRFLGHSTQFKNSVEGFRKSDGKLIYVETYDTNRDVVFGYTTPGGDLVASADNQAIKYILRAIQKTTTQMQGGVFLAEMRKTMTMIKSPAIVLRKGLGDYLATASRRASKAPRKSRKKIVADTWLEYSFGWTPLAADIKDAIAAYKALVKPQPVFKLTRTGKADDFSEQWNGGSLGPVPCSRYTRYRRSVGVRYMVAMKNQVTGISAVSGAAEQFGLVAGQFIPTLWELLPWSFLVDYFTNIGDILNAGATSTSNVVWVCKTVRGQGEVISTVDADEQGLKATYEPYAGGPYAFVYKHSPGNWYSTKTFVERSSPIGIGWPRFEVSLPGQPTQWVNMGALAVSQSRARKTLNL